MKKEILIRHTCRICGSRKLKKILVLGSMPPANAFLLKKESKAERAFPLTLMYCKKCTLAQLEEVVDPRILFKGYSYVTNASTPLVSHFVSHARETLESRPLSKKDLVVDIGSNDGTLLMQFKKNARVLGVDPALNIAKIARKNGVPTEVAFFSTNVAKKIKAKYGAASIVLANNVFAHIDDIHEVLRGVKELLTEDGVFISESHWVGNLLGDGGFDQIYHEHLSYYSLHALVYLAHLHDMEVIDVTLVPIHGASLRVTMAKKGKPSAAVRRFLAREKKLGLTSVGAFKTFASKVDYNKKELTTLLSRLRHEGKTIVGYGAPAKGNTLLNYMRIGSDTLTFITDTTPLKQGRLTPGMHIPVVPPARLTTEKPDYILLLSWNYAKPILEKEKRLREKGVKFIIPVPRVKVL